MKRVRQIPPRFANFIMRLLLRRNEFLEKTGDMEEVYFYILEDKGKLKANIWYWIQTIKAVPVLLINSILWGGIMFRSYFKIAYRNILKNKFYSAINILGFALSLAAFIIIALYVQYEFSFDKHNENADRIYRVVRNKPSGESGEIVKTSVTPTPLAPLLREEFPEIISAARIIKSEDVLITYGDNKFMEEKIHWADPETFGIFTIPLIAGNKEASLNEPFSVLLSEKTARKYFGSENALGKILKVYEQYDFVVTGVFEDMPVTSHFTMDVIFPFRTYFQLANRDIESWQGNFLYTYILLNEHSDYHELIAKFPAMLNTRIYQKFNINIPDKFKEILTLQPISEIHLHSKRNQEIEANGDYNSVVMLGSIAVLFLIIACINYMNLATAKSGRRGKEVGLRKVVGAQRNQLIYQFFGESMMLTLVAFIISIVISVAILPSFNRFLNCSVSLDLFNNPSLLEGLLLLVLVVGFFAGSYPAIMISGFSPISVLKGTFSRSSKGSFVRNALVLMQFAITIIFLVITFIVGDQLRFIQNKDAGYSKEQIITLEVKDKNIKQNIESVKGELLSYPGVIEVSASYRLPNNIDEHQSFERADNSSGLGFMIYTNYADYDFVDLYGIKIVQGRNFSKDYSSDQNGAFLINETAAKAAGWENPIGQEFTHYSGLKGPIVGVMKDFHLRSFHYPIEPVYIMCAPDEVSFLSLKVSPNNIPASIDHIESVVKKFSPNYPFEYKFFDEVFESEYKTEQKLGTLFSAFATLAVIVACLGLFGLSAYAAETRTKEIGIRKAMGASISSVFLLLSKQFLRWVLLANIIAWPLAYYFMQSWLNEFAYRIDLGAGVFILSGIITVLVALLTVSRQAHKAAKVNPINSLKCE